jgi:hypothetical protein
MKNNKDAIMSAAFDDVNVKLLIKRRKIEDLPFDVMDLLKA